MKKKKRILLFVLSTSALSLCLIGQSSYIVPVNQLTPIVSDEAEIVSYIVDSQGHRRNFATVDKAISTANLISDEMKVYVVPGAKAMITTDGLIIGSNVTLILPYSGETYSNETENSDGSVTCTKMGDYKFATNDPNNCKNKLEIADNVSVINQGSILIGGEINYGSGGNGNFSGQTSGNYATIVLGKGAQLVNRGNIDCRGFIQEVTLNNGSSIHNYGQIQIPFIMMDFGGGNFFACSYMNLEEYKASPFNMYAFINIETTLYTYFGGTMIIDVRLYAGDRYNTAEGILVGSSTSSLIQLHSGAYMVSKFTRTGDTIACPNVGKTKIDIYGGANTNGLNISVETGLPILSVVSINTIDVVFPITFLYDINLHAGEYSMLSDFKLMPGAALYVDSDATLEAQSLIIYPDTWTDGSTIKTKYPSISVTGSAKFTIDGKVIAANLGGRIDIGDSSTADLTIVESASRNSIELYNGAMYNKGTTETISCNTNLRLIDDASIVGDYVNGITSHYVSRAGKTNEGLDAYGWKEVPQQFHPEIKVRFDSGVVETYCTVSYIKNGEVVFLGSNIGTDSDLATSDLSIGTSILIDESLHQDSWVEYIGLAADNGSYSISSCFPTIRFHQKNSILQLSVETTGNSADDVSYTIFYNDLAMENTQNYLFHNQKENNVFNNDSAFDVRVGGYINIYKNAGDVVSSSGLNNKGNDWYQIVDASPSITIDYCILPGTLILLPDGSTRPIEAIAIGDIVMTWNFEKGCLEPQPIIFNEVSHQVSYTRIRLFFEDGSTFDVADEHSFFDYERREYFCVDRSTAVSTIGKALAIITKEGLSFKRVKDVQVEEATSDAYSPITAKNFNLFADHLMIVEPIICDTNFFEIGPDFRYDEKKKKMDIERYGLYGFEDFEDVMTKEEFDVFNGPIFKIGVGKGLFSEEKLREIIRHYLREGK